jgi:DNA-binding SARP family transcriptional activator
MPQDDSLIPLLFVEQSPIEAPQVGLYAYSLGDFRLSREGCSVADIEWKRKRARSLLAYLIYRQGQFLSRDHLLELFWPDHDIEAAQRNFAAQLHLLRRILEPNLQRGQASRYLLHEHEGYRFDPDGLIWSDVRHFDLLYKHAMSYHCEKQWCKAAQAFLQLVKLYRGAYLSNELYEQWCIVPRRLYLKMYLDALLHLSDYAFQQGDHRQSLHWLNQGQREDNCHEELYVRRIRVYQHMALYNEALRCYHDYCEVMEEELDSLPSPQMRSVYEQLRTICPSKYHN